MKKKIIFPLLFLYFSITLCATTINTSNYKTFIGEKVKFAETIPDKQYYKIGRKKLSTKKYKGKISLLSNIELDKKGNIIIFLTTSFKNNKEKTIKIKTKSKEVVLQNISIFPPPRPKRATSSKASNFSHKQSESDSSYQNDKRPTFIVIVFIAFIVIWLKSLIKDRTLVAEVTNTDRGEKSERDLILKLRHAGFSSEEIFHDLYIPLGNNHFSQIDLVLVSNVGLIVFEVKDYSGWLFGNETQRQWTQVLNYGREKHRFYNPIMQNAQHIRHLKSYLGQNIPCFSVIVFYGNCELKNISFMPQNTYLTTKRHAMRVINKILATEPPITYAKHIIPLLQNAVYNGNNPNIRQQHIYNIYNRLDKD